MNVSLQTQAVLLLTARFSKPTSRDPKPLTATEWGRFAQWLKEQGMTPEVLLTAPDPIAYLQGWSDRHITQERIGALLSRSGALGLALEKWQRAGLWVIIRSDVEYPTRLKRRLKFDAPPLLFGCGNPNLLEQGGVAVIGSRDATPDDLTYATKLGETSSSQGYTVISGGARGVDEAAMMGALAQDGTVVGVLADSLLRTATSAKYRQGLLAKNAVLISPFYPEAGFEVGNAMARNKYVYCLADTAIVVATGKNKGGTWHGATENLKQNWVPLWIKQHANPASGNAALVERGGRWLPEGGLDLRMITNPAEVDKTEPMMASLFELPAKNGKQNTVAEAPNEAVAVTKPIIPTPVATKVEVGVSAEQLSFYEFFLLKLGAVTNTAPAKPDDLLAQFEISKSQLNEWLSRAVTEEKVIKLNKPVRYQLVSTRQGNLDL
ncbi:MAG: DNA-processing protein DprA [Caldilineaceae bacterium]